MADSGGGNDFVVDELLCFVSCWMNREPADLLIKECVSAFTEKDIWEAKKRFFEVSGGSTRCVPRREGVKPKAQHDMEDLLREIIMATSEKRVLPTFVAKDVTKLPRGKGGASQDGEFGSIFNKLDSLSKRLTSIEAHNASWTGTLASIAAAMPKVGGCTEAVVGHLEQNELPKGDNAGISSGDGGGDTKRDGAVANRSVEDVAGAGLGGRKPEVKGYSQAVTLGQKARPRLAGGVGTSKKDETNGMGGNSEPNINAVSSVVLPDKQTGQGVKKGGRRGEEEFTVVDYSRKAYKRKTSRVVVGTRADSRRVTGIQRQSTRGWVGQVDIYVGRCELQTTEEELTQFLEAEGILITGCEKLKSKSKSCASFRIRVPAKHKVTILDPALWATGVEIRPFYYQGERGHSEEVTIVGKEKDKTVASLAMESIEGTFLETTTDEIPEETQPKHGRD